ncbi:MAG: hypothetical protein M0Z27_02530 [Thermaerobacter sp.]|nr:hypothetical protein [Thermaerobacter sp.]MDA8144926.1 hypothetical protein [Thermaerobacter sp.]
MGSFWTYFYNGLFMGIGLGTVLGAIINLISGSEGYQLMFIVMAVMGILFALIMVLFRNMIEAKSRKG